MLARLHASTACTEVAAVCISSPTCDGWRRGSSQPATARAQPSPSSPIGPSADLSCRRPERRCAITRHRTAARRRRAAEARDQGAPGLGFGGKASYAQELSSVKQALGGVESNVEQQGIAYIAPARLRRPPR